MSTTGTPKDDEQCSGTPLVTCHPRDGVRLFSAKLEFVLELGAFDRKVVSKDFKAQQVEAAVFEKRR